MTQENKELLLKDLSARLSYGVKLKTPKGDGHLNEITLSIFGTNVGVNIQATIRDYLPLEDCKPYLLPMSSMTEEEINEYENFIVNEKNDQLRFCNELVFYNSHHLDYRGLIDKGLALEAPKDMYN